MVDPTLLARLLGAVWQEGITTLIFDIVIAIPSELINLAFTVLLRSRNLAGDYAGE
jgi:hypothetical protein